MSPNLDDIYIHTLTTCCLGGGGGRVRGEKVWSQELRLRPPLGKMVKEAKDKTKMGLGRGPIWSRGTDRLHRMQTTGFPGSGGLITKHSSLFSEAPSPLEAWRTFTA